MPGLGFVKGSCCPHYSDIKGWRPAYHRFVRDGQLCAGYGISERAAIHYVNGQFSEALIEFDQAGVYQVERDGDGAIRETKLPARMLTIDG